MPDSHTHFFPGWRHFFAGSQPRRSKTPPPALPSTLAQIEQQLAPALPTHLLAQSPSRAHSRKRIFTRARTVWGWIWQAFHPHSACREVVRQVQAIFALAQAGFVDEATSAYCQSRRKLPTALLGQLFAASARSAEQAAPTPDAPKAPLQNRPVRVADMSGMRLQDSPKNRAAYPPSANLPKGTGFPYLRLVVLFSLASGAMLAYASGSQHCSELRLFFSLLAHLQRGEIVLGDRSYGRFVVAALLQTLGVDLLATVNTRNRKVDFRRPHQRLAPHDALFVWKKPGPVSPLCTATQWAALPAQLVVRMIQVRVQRRGYRPVTLTIVTTLLDPKLYPAEEIIATHARRWRLEMGLDDLKTTLGLENLRCHCPAMVEKELLVGLIAYNLVRWLMAQAATARHVALESLSFKGTLDTFRQWSQAMTQRRSPKHRARLWQELLATIAADTLPWRPDRHEPRAVKKRSKYPHLNKPRHLYVDRWSRGKRRRVATAKKRQPLN